MRSAALLVFAVLLALTSGSCDTTQPLQADQQPLELFVTSTSFPPFSFYNVFEGTSDCNDDGQPDDDDMNGEPDVFLWCLDRPIPPSGQPTGFPWNFTIEITIIRNGSATPEALTSAQAREFARFSITPSDRRENYVIQPIPVPSPIFLGGCLFSFDQAGDPGVRTTVFRDVLASTTNPLTELDPNTYGKGEGLCSTNDPGEAVIDSASGSNFPFPIVLGKGDTITVQSVRSVTPPDGVDFDGPGPSVTARLLLDGTPIGVRGTQDASADTGSFSFSYTSR